METGSDVFDEIALVEAARRGDLEAFNRLVVEYQDLIYHRACWILQDPYQAEDLTQEAFLQAYRRLDAFRGGSFRAWLARIVTNSGYDELRRRKRRGEQPLTYRDPSGEEQDETGWIAAPGRSLEESFEQKELRSGLQQYLDMLPAEYREVVFLVDILEMDYAEAAASLEVPLGTVKSRLARARRSLRDRLENDSRILDLAAVAVQAGDLFGR